MKRFTVTGLFICFIHFFHTPAYAQLDTSRPTTFPCGFSMTPPATVSTGGGGGAGLVGITVGSGYSMYPAGAIVSCGPYIKIYYDDLAEGILYGHHAGFDDPTVVGSSTLGAIRRNTICLALDYITQTFDFSHVNPAHPVRIHFRQSYDPVYNPAHNPGYLGVTDPTLFVSRSFPFLDTTSDGIKETLLAHYIKTGNDDSINSYLADLQYNFDKTFQPPADPTHPWAEFGVQWHNDGTKPVACNAVDLYSNFLHEFGHCMGWASYIWHTGNEFSLFTPNPVVKTHHVFTKLDSSIYVSGSQYPLTTSGGGLNPLLIFFAGSYQLNPLMIHPHNNDYWLSNQEAPANYPVYSGSTLPYGANSGQFIVHLDEQPFSYTFRGRVSPGARVEYVMGPYVHAGAANRKYTEGDLYGFHDIMGYPYATATFAASNPGIHLGNSAPYSKKMGKYNITRSNFGYFTETVKADTTITNNTGTYIDFNIDTMPDIVDGNGDEVFIDVNSLLNFRGCGNGGNNHNSLSWVVPGKILRYTPRHDFFGRAQFGYYIKDLFDSGSFVVMTVDVKKGTNVSYSTGDNMVSNPGFEEGTELATAANPTILNVTGGTTGGRFREGNWQAIVFSDSHPYDFHSNDSLIPKAGGLSAGIVVKNSQFSCLGNYNSDVGNFWLTAPEPELGVANPDEVDGGQRYQFFWSPGGSYYLLKDTLKTCKRYKLEYDLYRKGAGTGTLPFTVGFTDTVVNLSLFPTPLPPGMLNHSMMGKAPDDAAGMWTHQTIPFWYCGNKPSTVMYMSSPTYSLILDNISLVEDTSPPLALKDSVIQDTAVNCGILLTVKTKNAACHLTYTWVPDTGVIISHPTDSTVIVPADTSINYTVYVNDGCRNDTATIPVISKLPSPIAGIKEVCAGAITNLTDTLHSGKWYSADTMIATVDSLSGAVKGKAEGAATISYRWCSRAATTVVTVHGTPPAITGTVKFCAGTTSALANPNPGGTWSSSNPVKGTVDIGGTVTGIGKGTTTITYTFGPTCYTTAVVTVDSIPALGPITTYGGTLGNLNICVGATSFLDYIYYIYPPATADLGTGNWTSSNTAVADFTGISTGINTVYVKGISPGTAVITYTANHCGLTSTSAVVTINPSPGPISGTGQVCVGATTSMANTLAGGDWSSSNPAIATIGTAGLVTGVAAGTLTITYKVGLCTVTRQLTVNAMPVPITGPSTVCMGNSITLANPIAGGTWSSSVPAIATVNTAGKVTGITAGTTMITYTIACGTSVYPVTVNAGVSAISGNAPVCKGYGLSLAGTPVGGTWSSSAPAIGTIDTVSGLFNALAAGTATVSYTNGCGIKTAVVTVNPLPAPITGPFNLCLGITTTFSDATPGGTWVEYGSSLLSVGTTTGMITGLTAGSGYIKYTLPTGCFLVNPVTVNPVPGAISGPSTVCLYEAITLTNPLLGGSWSSGMSGSAVVSSASGIVSGILPGPDTITYSMPSGCFVTYPITVNALPAPITGGATVCAGNDLALSSATIGGTWSSSAPAIASISAMSGGGLVTGIAAGSGTISYILSTGCAATLVVTVNTGVSPIIGDNSVCLLNTLLLNDTTTGGTWSSSNPAVATIGISGEVHPVSVTGIMPTIVSITYTIPNGCYAGRNIFVYKDNGLCSPCNTANFGIWGGGGMTQHFNTLPAYIADPLSSGYYYLLNDATVLGDIIADDAKILAASGTSLAVHYTSSMTLNGSRIFSCDNSMWKGITLQSGLIGADSITGRVTLQTNGSTGQSTLIEDAINGIQVNGNGKPYITGSYIIDSRDAIFNRNYTGISITNHTPLLSSLPGLPNQYEYRFSNTTFTSRKLADEGVPYHWYSNSGLSSLRINTGSGSPSYNLPYSITSLPSLTCRNGLVPAAGIYLEGVGKTTGSSYTGALIGAPGYYGPSGPTNDVWNLFDNLGNGIVAVNSNISVQNNVFANLRTTVTGGTLASSSYIDRAGVYTNMTDGNRYRLEVVPAVSGYGATAMSNGNSFYDCKFGVYSKDYNSIRCEKSVMRSTQNLLMDGYSKYGFMLQSSSYEDVQVNENKIYNIANGIAFTSAYGMPYPIVMPGGIIMYGMPYQHLGNLAINGNSIQAVLGTAPTIGEYVSTGISVQNALPAGTANTPVGNVQTMGNYMKDVHRGILVQGYQTQQAYTGGNVISVSKYNCEKSWGIAHANNYMDAVGSNTVTATYSKNDLCLDSARAYIMELDNSSLVTCNSASGTGRGFEFFHTNQNMQWKHNTMDQHNSAMYLNNASIDQQGYLYHPNDNIWNNPSWWSNAAAKYQTYVNGSPASTASNLYVRPGSFTQPTANWGDAPSHSYYTAGLFPTSGYVDQQVCPEQAVTYPAMARAAHEQPILDAIDYDAFSDARLWISQLQAWEAINHDTTLADSSAILGEFMTRAAGSRFAYLTQVEHLLTSGDMAGAAALIGSSPAPLDPALTYDSTTGVTVKDDTSIDYIIHTHKDFYTVYLHYLNRTMNGADSAKIPYIAQLCPLQYGEVVYKARALYTAVWNDLRVWCEGCDVYSGQQQQPPRNKKRRITSPATDNGQQYTLTPNPNTGVMNITQVAGDSDDATVEITDMLGRNILHQAIHFTGHTAPVALQNPAPGMYVLKLTDTKQRNFIFKFIVQ